MTIARMKNYINLRKEIVLLDQEISLAGSAEYTEGNVEIITGFNTRVLDRLHERRAACIEECNAIENYVLDIKDDSLIMQLLTYRFIEGFTLEATALAIGYSTKQVCRIIRAHFKL